MAAKEKIKTACLFDKTTGELIDIVTLKGTKEQFDQWNTWTNLTYVIPSQEIIDARDEGTGVPIYDAKKKKWSLKDMDESHLEEDKIEAKNVTNRVIADFIRENKIEFGGKIFSIDRRSSYEYLELYVLAFTGVIDFPISIKADNSNEVVQFSTIEDFKQFMKALYDSKSNIIKIGRALKYGGNVFGIDVKPISEFNVSEMHQFDPRSAIDSLIELSKENE